MVLLDLQSMELPPEAQKPPDRSGASKGCGASNVSLLLC